MTDINRPPVFGNIPGESGLVIAGIPVFGTESVKPDYSPIDMTTETPDKRLRYYCDSSHAYIGVDGLLRYAGPNEYPLEGVNGVAAGRHEPEPQSTNLYSGGNVAPYVPSSVGNQSVTSGFFSYGDVPTWRYTWNTTPTGNNYNLSQRSIPLTAGTFEYSVAIKIIQSDVNYDESTIQLLLDVFWQGSGTLTKSNARVVRKLANGFYLCSLTMTTTGSGTAFVRVYIPSATFAAFTHPFIFECGPLQIEADMRESSHIKTAGAAATRATAFLEIETQGATGCVLLFNNGETNPVLFNGDPWFPLPSATHDWGYRLIKNIEYTQ